MFQAKWRHNSKTYRAEYCAWCDARQRCTNPKSAGWKYYGARGIQMCARWLNDFDAFMDDMGPRPAGMTIERRDVNGDYDPFNCVWASQKTQSGNKRSSISLTFQGVTKLAAEWADDLGITRNTIFERIKRGLPVEKILSKKTLVPEPQHGTISRYVSRKCRCERCRRANTEYGRELRKRTCQKK